MKSLEQYTFRDLYKQYVYLHTRNNFAKLTSFYEGTEKATGVLAYCCAVHEQGLVFEMLCCASLNEQDNKLHFYSLNPQVSVKFRWATVHTVQAMLLPEAVVQDSILKSRAAAVYQSCIYNEAVEKTRFLLALDHLRAVDNPDVVEVQLVHGDDGDEKCHVLIENISEMNLSGILLDEPQQDLGLHKGDTLKFYLVKNKQGIMCIAMV